MQLLHASTQYGAGHTLTNGGPLKPVQNRPVRATTRMPPSRLHVLFTIYLQGLMGTRQGVCTAAAGLAYVNQSVTSRGSPTAQRPLSSQHASAVGNFIRAFA
jgi:hypothetical protein